MSARAHLRAATAQAHARVDRLFSAFSLSDPVQYGRFLVAQAAAFVPTERVIDASPIAVLLPDWPERRRSSLLLADLAELGQPTPPPLPAPALADPADLLGAVYVLEGSRLGGALLERAIPPGAPRRFISPPQPPGSWRNLLVLLDRHLPDPASLARATQSAETVFQRFELAARQQFEQRHAA